MTRNTQKVIKKENIAFDGGSRIIFGGRSRVDFGGGARVDFCCWKFYWFWRWKNFSISILFCM